ncbi:hypothetical protein GJAV_G00057520 [Gymnothorax javanicus]|nr:hypothetical protein GJAV_G00057520 [Gymnothorax javanicus]
MVRVTLLTDLEVIDLGLLKVVWGTERNYCSADTAVSSRPIESELTKIHQCVCNSTTTFTGNSASSFRGKTKGTP